MNTTSIEKALSGLKKAEAETLAEALAEIHKVLFKAEENLNLRQASGQGPAIDAIKWGLENQS